MYPTQHNKKGGLGHGLSGGAPGPELKPGYHQKILKTEGKEMEKEKGRGERKGQEGRGVEGRGEEKERNEGRKIKQTNKKTSSSFLNCTCMKQRSMSKAFRVELG
jgi:hypothetical protein